MTIDKYVGNTSETLPVQRGSRMQWDPSAWDHRYLWERMWVERGTVGGELPVGQQSVMNLKLEKI